MVEIQLSQMSTTKLTAWCRLQATINAWHIQDYFIALIGIREQFNWKNSIFVRCISEYHSLPFATRQSLRAHKDNQSKSILQINEAIHDSECEHERVNGWMAEEMGQGLQLTARDTWCRPPDGLFRRNSATGLSLPSGCSSSMHTFGSCTNIFVTLCSIYSCK